MELLFIYTISKRSNIKIRNLIINNPSAFGEDSGLNKLLNIHLRCLVQEKNYHEITVLDKIPDEHRIEPGLPAEIRDELFFNLSLKEIEQNHFEKALDYLTRIQKTTPAVMHNTALLYQKLERYGQANEHWIRLHQREKKPKRSDPEVVRSAYIAMLKYIAHNFLHSDQPEEAVPYFKEIFTFDRDDREALECLQRISSDLGKNREALLYAQRLYELDPDNDEYLFTYIVELQSHGRLDVAVPLYQKGMEKNPDQRFYQMGLAFCYAQTAFSLRKNNPGEARELILKAKKLEAKLTQLLYLEGFFLQEDGKRKSALNKFKQAIESTVDHLSEFQLGNAFYDDGMTDYALKVFKAIISCNCYQSDTIFERIIKHLAQAEDYKNTRLLCEMAIDIKGYDLYSISDILFDYNKPDWAAKYSTRLIQGENVDEEDTFLHLLILNAIGNKQETLDMLKISGKIFHVKVRG
ncbi:hypothetical protein ES703_124524 [subsurface metagenome]